MAYFHFVLSSLSLTDKKHHRDQPSDFSKLQKLLMHPSPSSDPRGKHLWTIPHFSQCNEHCSTTEACYVYTSITNYSNQADKTKNTTSVSTNYLVRLGKNCTYRNKQKIDLFYSSRSSRIFRQTGKKS